MKLLTKIGLLASATLAATFVDSPAKTPQAPDQEHGSCCEGGGPSPETAPRVSYLELKTPLGDDAKKGNLKGMIKFGGEERPETKPLTISEQASRGCTDGKVDDTDRSLLIHKDGGIRYAVVTVSVEGAEVKLPEENVVLDQIQCRFEPHVILLPTGVTVEYKNSDKISHNVHTHAVRNQPYNKTIAAGGSDTQKLESPESIKVTCDIHPWMVCYMFVTDTPYAAVTAVDGSFEIQGLPVGKHRVDVWHETLGRTRGEVTINADGTSEVLTLEMGETGGARGGRRRR
jgi:plastocyanin